MNYLPCFLSDRKYVFCGFLSILIVNMSQFILTTIMNRCVKSTDRMAKSVDPDQIVPS